MFKSPYTELKCLSICEKMFGKGLPQKYAAPLEQFSSLIWLHSTGEKELELIQGLTGNVGTVDEMNTLLKEKGFTIKLKPNDAAVLSILNLNLKWIKAEETEIWVYQNEKTYDAFHLKAIHGTFALPDKSENPGGCL